MILFTTDEKQVQISVDAGYPTKKNSGWLQACWWTFENATVAKVMRKYLADRFERKIREVREEEYEEGYRNGRSKKRKKEYFSGRL